MRKLIVFNHVSLDGYFTGANGDFNWARAGNDDAEYQAFVTENASGGGELLFGRVTYDLMASYWPTPNASKHDPKVAESMNAMPKTVFSRTMESAAWSNTTLVKDDIVAAVRKMKGAAGGGMAIFGSGQIVSQLASAGVIDEYQFVVNPVALGEGRTMFDHMIEPLRLKLTKSRIFGNGKVYLCYEPIAK